MWSQFGKDARADDDFDGTGEAANINGAIEKGAVDINFWILSRYSVTQLSASSWVKWCNVIFACCNLARRRGQSVPGGLADQETKYLEQLKAIAANKMGLPLDDGTMAAPRFDNNIAVSNVTADQRFKRSQVRVVEATSTGDRPGNGVKRNSAIDFGSYFQ